MSGDIFGCHSWGQECYWHLAGRDQDVLKSSPAQGRPTTENELARRAAAPGRKTLNADPCWTPSQATSFHFPLWNVSCGNLMFWFFIPNWWREWWQAGVCFTSANFTFHWSSHWSRKIKNHFRWKNFFLRSIILSTEHSGKRFMIEQVSTFL